MVKDKRCILSVVSGRRQSRWVALVLALVFTVAVSTLSILKHNSFHTQALDLAKFDQAIWNTLHGRFLYSTLESQSILGNHFSPWMAALAPLLALWDDVRVLLIAQTLGLAACGLLLYEMVRRKHEQIAPWFLLAFYLNPALHQVALVEFRRVTLAVPFLALALYAIYVRKRGWMALGLAVALLCKEDIAVIVFAVGIYLILFQRDWTWGLPLVVIGLLWAVVVTFWVIPAFDPDRSDGSGTVYPQLNAFGLYVNSYQEIPDILRRDPLMLVRPLFDPANLKTIGRVLLPVGLVLPFLAADWLLIVVPSLVLMLSSTAPGMHSLEGWYMAALLPGLFAAAAIGLVRRSRRWAGWLAAGLVGTTLVGYVLFSPAPLGGQYKPELYQVTAHHRLAAEAVDMIPAGARVATQDPYVPHLAHREDIYLYPWISIGLQNIDYLVLDRNLHPYPLQPYELDAQIDDLVADTSYVVEWEADGIHVLRQGGPSLPAFAVDATADETMYLSRVEMALQDREGRFQIAAQEPVEIEPGQTVRVSLYWQALAAPNAERTVSVRIIDGTGTAAAVHDNLPGKGKKPTSWWEQGWQIRDVYYLTLSPQAAVGPGRLNVLLYDSYSGELVPFEGQADTLTVCEVRICQSEAQ